MKTLRIVVVLLTVTAAAAFAQRPDNNANRERPRVSRSLNYGNWVGRHIMNKEFMDQVGIADEQAKKIKEEMEKIDARLRELDETINQSALQQAEIAKKILAEPGANVDEIMKMIERIGQLRTEQAKLSTQILVVIRDNLTAEQRKKAQALIAAEGQKRFTERMARREKEEHERPAGPRPPPPRPVAPQGW
jgi:seryl-tRNA synthetase